MQIHRESIPGRSDGKLGEDSTHLAAMDRGRPGRRYLLGNHNLSYREFMTLCAEVTGSRAPLVPVPGPRT